MQYWFLEDQMKTWLEYITVAADYSEIKGKERKKKKKKKEN